MDYSVDAISRAMHKMIRNDADHAAATVLSDTLWDSEPGTARHDQLELLAIMLGAYDKERLPFRKPIP